MYVNICESVLHLVEKQAFEVTQQEIESAKRMAKEQAPSVYDGGFQNDESLCRMLAISNKINPLYLQYLVCDDTNSLQNDSDNGSVCGLTSGGYVRFLSSL